MMFNSCKMIAYVLFIISCNTVYSADMHYNNDNNETWNVFNKTNGEIEITYLKCFKSYQYDSSHNRITKHLCAEEETKVFISPDSNIDLTPPSAWNSCSSSYFSITHIKSMEGRFIEKKLVREDFYYRCPEYDFKQRHIAECAMAPAVVVGPRCVSFGEPNNRKLIITDYGINFPDTNSLIVFHPDKQVL